MNFSSILFISEENTTASIKLEFPIFTWYCDITNGEEIRLPLYVKIVGIYFCQITHEEGVKIITPIPCNGEIMWNENSERFYNKYNLNFNIDPLPRGLLTITAKKV